MSHPPQVSDGTEPAITEVFAGKLAHQLRTSITALQGTHFLLSRQLPNLPAGTHQPMGRLLNLQIDAIKSLKHSVDQFLEYSGVDHLHLSHPVRPVQLVSLLNNLVQQANTDAHTSRIKFVDRLTPDFSADLNAALISLIVEALLSNSLKFSPEGTAVTATASNSADHWELCMEDSGPGIPAGEEELVFEPFFRASNVGQVPGSGLGLAIAKRATEHSSGTIAVAKPHGAGAKVVCRFPHRRSIESSIRRPTAPNP